MKMKFALASLAILAVATSQAQTSLETIYSFSDKRLVQTVTRPLFTAPDVLKIKGFDLDVRGFAGSSVNEPGTLAMGGIVAFTIPDGIARGIDPSIGLMGKWQTGAKPAVGLYFGVRKRF